MLEAGNQRKMVPLGPDRCMRDQTHSPSAAGLDRALAVAFEWCPGEEKAVRAKRRCLGFYAGSSISLSLKRRSAELPGRRLRSKPA
jgi:hypothetical protein